MNPVEGRLEKLLEVRKRLDYERRAAPSLWASLERDPQPRRLERISVDPAMQTWGLYDLLVHMAQEATPVWPFRGIELAQLALAVVVRLEPEIHGETRITDFQAVALAALGNAKRVAEDFEGAKADLGRALELLEDGTGDPLEREPSGFLEHRTRLLP
jgi:hypothetical protein